MDFRKLYGPNFGFSTKKGFKIRDPQISWYPFGTKNHEMRGPPVLDCKRLSTQHQPYNWLVLVRGVFG